MVSSILSLALLLVDHPHNVLLKWIVSVYFLNFFKVFAFYLLLIADLLLWEFVFTLSASPIKATQNPLNKMKFAQSAYLLNVIIHIDVENWNKLNQYTGFVQN